MCPMEECRHNLRYAYIALNMIQGVGPVTVGILKSVLGDVGKIFELSDKELLSISSINRNVLQAIVENRNKVSPVLEEKRAKKIGAKIITQVDDDYPQWLKQFSDAPIVIYVLGSFAKNDKRSIAVVGTRHPTHYGREMAARISRDLTRCGFTVVSGMARGIDTIAHKSAIEAGGRTIAVLGGALDHIYPPENKELAKNIAENGVIISEFPFGRVPDKTTFPIRNRIVSGLSMGVIVVEAGLTSGAIITANIGVEQGKLIFALPGRVDSPASRGCHKLIKEGAKLVENADDILEEFQFLGSRLQYSLAKENMLTEEIKNVSADAQQILKLLNDGEKDVDTLIRLSGIDAGKMNALLVELEIKRKIKLLPGRMVELCRL